MEPHDHNFEAIVNFKEWVELIAQNTNHSVLRGIEKYARKSCYPPCVQHEQFSEL